MPFADNSIFAIYASHLLEHLYLEEAKTLLRDCYRILEPGGTLRVVAPDLAAAVSEYVDSRSRDHRVDQPTVSTRADRLNEKLGFHEKTPPPANPLYRFSLLLGDLSSHKWMYDSESLIAYFRWAGFYDAEERRFRESRIPGIEEVEMPERVLHGAGFCVEGTKLWNSPGLSP